MLTVNKKIGISNVQFTPNYYKNAYRQYQQGYYKDLIEMMKRAAVDSHVAGCLLGRRSGFQREFSLLPFDDTALDRERAEWLRSMFTKISMRSLFKAIHEATLYKFVVIDFEWDTNDNKHVICGFKKFEQRYFKYRESELKIDFGNNQKDIPNEALICENEDNPVMLPVLRDYILKDFGLESWAGFIETFGEGIIIGKYPAGADSTVKSEIETAVNNIARSSRGTMPENANIEVVGYESRIGSHDKFIEAADRGISITILGHENAVSQSKGLQVGENITSYRVKCEIAKDDMFFIDEQMQKVVNTVCERNFSDGRFPVFVTDKSDPVNVKEWLDVIDTAYNHGVIIDPDDYRKVGLKIAEEQEPVQKLNPF
jgi:phage gp29-like protein